MRRTSTLRTKTFFFISSLSAVNKIAGIFFEFFLTVVLARTLGADQYGLYSYALVIISAAATISTLGFDSASLRFIPEYKTKNQWEFLYGFTIFSTITVIISSIGISCLVVLTGIILKLKNNNLGNLLIWSPLLIPLLSIARLRQYILRSLKYIIISEVLELIARPILLSLTLLCIYFVKTTRITAYDTLIINIPILFFLGIIGLILLYINLPKKDFLSKRKFHKNIWLKVTFPLFLVSIIQLVTGYTDTLMIGAFSSYTESGIYSVAVRISSFSGFSLIAINMILAPIISELFFCTDYLRLQYIITKTTRIATAISILISAFILIYGKSILYQFGPGFENGYAPLLILIIGQLISVSCGSVGLLLSLTGHQACTVKILTVSSMLNIALNFLLIPSYGMTGAAIASTISTATWNIFMARNVAENLNIKPTILTSKNVAKT